MNAVEVARLATQSEIDDSKSRIERNRLGQFATPTAMAEDVLAFAKTFLPRKTPIRFLDPAIGTGSFYSALLKVFPKSQIKAAVGYEIDPLYAQASKRIWEHSELIVHQADFTRQRSNEKFNLLICNPPYVRHHHLTLSEKERLQHEVFVKSEMQLSGLAGLYCYFMGLSHTWMASGGVAAWLIPSEFMDVNYGRIIKGYLLNKVTLLHIHRFDPKDVQFADALVSSAVVVFRNEIPPANHAVSFSFGGTLLKPSLTRLVPSQSLAQESKWTRFPLNDERVANEGATISDFFDIRRGLATGNNNFFILKKSVIDAQQLPMEVFRPILPSPRHLPNDEVLADANGIPILEDPLFLLDTKLSESEIFKRYPRLSKYLENGKADGVHQTYLCSHREPWYSQENRPSAPIVCSYIGRADSDRDRPFRFIRNHSKATVTNGYLAMYPKGALAKALEENPLLICKVWMALLSITPEQLLSEGRVYGGGMHKLEPKELAKVDASVITQFVR
jgi:adenine-specific DNA-methyltransferase